MGSRIFFRIKNGNKKRRVEEETLLRERRGLSPKLNENEH